MINLENWNAFYKFHEYPRWIWKSSLCTNQMLKKKNNNNEKEEKVLEIKSLLE